MTTAADHLREAIAEGCTRSDEHDHIADHAAEVRAEHNTVIARWLLKKAAEYRSTGGAAAERRQHAMQAETIERLADKLRRGAARPNNLLTPSPEFETESWPGELRALRRTLSVLRTVARHAADEHLRTELQQELAEYDGTEQDTLAAARAAQTGGEDRG